MVKKALFLILLMLILTACTGLAVAVPTQTRAETVELGDALSVHVIIEATAGDLSIDGGASHLLDANFRYNRPELNPTVTYRAADGAGELIVSNRANGNEISGEIRGMWALRFNDKTPLDIDISRGMGETNLDLSNLTVSRLVLQNGSGPTTIDLRGMRQDDLAVAIRGGFGDLTLILPESTGVRVKIDRPLGDVNTSGLHADDTLYVNDAYRRGASVTLDIDIQGGAGDITLRTQK